MARDYPVRQRTSMSTVKLWLSFDSVTKLALSIPVDKCSSFSVNPLKWLRYLGFVIYGQEGYLSRSKAGPEIDDYTANIEARSYYFVSHGKIDYYFESMISPLLIFYS
jgi:hypothetical protein